MRRKQRHTLFAFLLLFVGLSQAGIALSAEQDAYTMFYVVFGGGLALVGGVTLWVERRLTI
jgi:hypothetical protein